MLEGYTDHPERTRISFFIPARLPSSQYISETGIIYFIYLFIYYNYHHLNIYLKRELLLTSIINISIFIIVIINISIISIYI